MRQSFMLSAAKLVGGTAALSMLPLVEQAAAAHFGVGAVATLGYANKLPALIGGLAVSALAVAVFPYFSEMFAKGDIVQCRKTLRLYSGAIAGGGALIAVVLILGSEAIVRTVFERGAFSESATASVAFAQQAYLVQIPGALVFTLASRMLLAQGRAGMVGLLQLAQLILFAGGAVIAVHVGGHVAAIALAYSAAVTLTATGAHLIARQSLKVSAAEAE